MVTAGILRPHSPELLSSLARDPGCLPWCLRLLSALFYLNIMVGYIETASLIISAGLAILLPLVDLLEFISQPIHRGPRDPSFVSTNWFFRLRLYRNVQLLMCELNEVYGMLIIGVKILLILFAVFCTYGGIRFGGMLAMCLAWIGFSTTTYLAVMLNTMGEFREKCKYALAKANITEHARDGHKCRFVLLHGQSHCAHHFQNHFWCRHQCLVAMNGACALISKILDLIWTVTWFFANWHSHMVCF